MTPGDDAEHDRRVHEPAADRAAILPARGEVALQVGVRESGVPVIGVQVRRSPAEDMLELVDERRPIRLRALHRRERSPAAIASSWRDASVSARERHLRACRRDDEEDRAVCGCPGTPRPWRHRARRPARWRRRFPRPDRRCGVQLGILREVRGECHADMARSRTSSSRMSDGRPPPRPAAPDLRRFARADLAEIPLHQRQDLRLFTPATTSEALFGA